MHTTAHTHLQFVLDAIHRAVFILDSRKENTVHIYYYTDRLKLDFTKETGVQIVH